MMPLMLVGGGGQCRSAIDVLESTRLFEILGIIESPGGPTDPVLSYQVLGTDDDLDRLLAQCPNFLITIGQIRSPLPRMLAFNRIHALGGSFPTAVSANAYVSPRGMVNVGSIVMHGAVVTTNATVGENCIINSLALIEHDATIGSHCHISTGARVNGGVIVGSGTFIGSGSIIHEGVTIGDNCVIAAGSLVRADVASGSIIRTER